jgi:hypothetical protein
VYPGATEEVCVLVLERHSGKRWKQDFFVGYSPERINPGDKKHTLSTVTKAVAGDTPKTLDTLVEFYGAVVSAGVHRASSVRVAEAAKVIENTQRGLNIALMNELRSGLIATRGRADPSSARCRPIRSRCHPVPRSGSMLSLNPRLQSALTKKSPAAHCCANRARSPQRRAGPCGVSLWRESRSC